MKKSIHPRQFESSAPSARVSPDAPADGAGTRARAPAPAAGPRLRILLAEDDALNRHVASVILTRSGHAVVAVTDGRAAVRDALSGHFDAVVMDVDMPILDGLSATRRIRELERGTGRRLPIVALTGHVGSDQEDRVREAGADGYVAKPFDVASLLGEIEAARVAARAAADSDDRPAFDRGQFLARIGGDESLLGDLIGGFLEDLPARIEAIDRALKGRDGAALASVAHTLCGALLSLAAEPAADAARALERRAKDSPEAARACAGALERELERLAATLSATGPVACERGRA